MNYFRKSGLKLASFALGVVLLASSTANAADAKGGAVVSGTRFFSSPTCHHAPDVYDGLGETESAEMLKSFFRERRDR